MKSRPAGDRPPDIAVDFVVPVEKENRLYRLDVLLQDGRERGCEVLLMFYYVGGGIIGHCLSGDEIDYPHNIGGGILYRVTMHEIDMFPDQIQDPGLLGAAYAIKEEVSYAGLEPLMEDQFDDLL